MRNNRTGHLVKTNPIRHRFIRLWRADKFQKTDDGSLPAGGGTDVRERRTEDSLPGVASAKTGEQRTDDRRQKASNYDIHLSLCRR